MIKTVKVKKQLRLDELIKYIFENGIKGNTHLIDYESNLKTNVFVDFSGQVSVQGSHFGNELFTVEVEEEITEDTTFERLVTLGIRGTINVHDDKSLSDLSDNSEPYRAQVFALINGKLEIIWEAE